MNLVANLGLATHVGLRQQGLSKSNNLNQHGQSFQTYFSQSKANQSDGNRQEKNVNAIKTTAVKEVKTVDGVKDVKDVNEVKPENKVTKVKEVVSNDVIRRVNEKKATIEDETLALVSEELGISEEELETLLIGLNMTILEIFDPQKLQQLLQSHFGLSEASDILVNQDFSSSFKQISEKLQQVIDGTGLQKSHIANYNRMMTFEGKSQSQSHNQQKPEQESIQSQPLEMPTKEGLVAESKAGDMSEPNLMNQATMLVENEESTIQQQPLVKTKEVILDTPTNLQGLAQAKVNGNDFATMIKSEIINHSQETQVNVKEVIEQIVTKMNVTVKTDSSSMQLQLKPESLGKIGVNITSEAGLIKGQFVAENQAVKEVLETHLIQLKEQLAASGIKVEKMEVILGNSSQFFHNKEQEQAAHNFKQSKRGRVRRLEGIDGQSDDISVNQAKQEQQHQRQVLRTEIDENTVEYSA